MKIFTYERLAAMPLLSALRCRLSGWPVSPAATTVGSVRRCTRSGQAELILTVAPAGVEGTSGFTGNGIQVAKKRMDVRGVPPRGKTGLTIRPPAHLEAAEPAYRDPRPQFFAPP